VKRESSATKSKKMAVERGSSALRGAADSMIAVVRIDDEITLKCAKPPKDGPAFPTITLKPVNVQLEEIDESCVLERVPTPGPPLRDRFSKKGTFEVLEALVQRKDAARYAELQKELCAKGKGPGLKKRTFARALKSVWEMEYAAKAKLPNEAGSKYVVTEAGRAVYPKIAAIRKRQ